MNRCYSWWKTLSVREQRLLLITIGLTVPVLLYGSVVLPLQQQNTLVKNQLSAERNLLAWVAREANVITQLRARGERPHTEQPLNQAVANSTTRFGIRLIRMQPREESIQVWIEPLPFDQFVGWLALLRRQHGIHVVRMDINRSDKSGMIEVKRLDLSRG